MTGIALALGSLHPKIFTLAKINITILQIIFMMWISAGSFKIESNNPILPEPTSSEIIP